MRGGEVHIGRRSVIRPAKTAFYPNSIVNRSPLLNAMGMILRFAALLFCVLFYASCQNRAPEKTISGLPEAGALYSLFDGEGGYRIGKVVSVEDQTVFLHLFEDRWLKRPSPAETRKASKALPVAYKPESFSDMNPVKLKLSAVTPEEKETYETWKNGNQEIF
jgi:hypothetical protein